MTADQEDALYTFLDDTPAPFTLRDAASAVRSKDSRRFGRLQAEIANLFDGRRAAFPIDENKWLSRRGVFDGGSFAITPTRAELLTGILIPGHRCLPFANPMAAPYRYSFFWKGKPIPMSAAEGSPDEFYPFYSLFGEEFAPQYIAQESPENALAFTGEDRDEQPYEVSIKALDMRHIYREAGFVPGDRFLARVKDWRSCSFNLERVAADDWPKAALEEWAAVAEDAFHMSFERLGPGISTDEQIAWAYFYGRERMVNAPAYSLEDFMYDKTDKFTVSAFGLESRFWFAGKEIPDYSGLRGIKTQSDETPIEHLLFQHGVPVSEYVVQSYIRDAIFRRDCGINSIMERIVPAACGMTRWNADYIAGYIADALKEFQGVYSVFTDRKAGPIRQQVCELHTAVIEMACRLKRDGIDHSILPKHTFIVLSQIQNYTAGILEDLDTEDEPDEQDLNAIDHSIEDMVDIFDEIKDMIDKSRDSFRRTNLTLVRNDGSGGRQWRTVQISIGGTDVWRRLFLPRDSSLDDLHRVILCLFGWSGRQRHRFTLDYITGTELAGGDRDMKESVTLSELAAHYLNEVNYEYGTRWTVKIILSACTGDDIKRPSCAAGGNAPPPESVEGPLRYRRFVSALDGAEGPERDTAVAELGADFDPYFFDLNDCNRRLSQLAISN